MFRVTKVFPFFIVVQLLLLSNPCRAQLVCGTTQPTDAQLLWQANTLSLKQAASARQSAEIRYLPIRFHVIRRDNGTGGTDIASLNQALVLLNQLYQPMGVAFYMCGSAPHYIDNTSLFDYDNTEESALADPNDVSYAINIYLPNTLSYLGNQTAGYSYFPAQMAVTNRLFVLASQVTGYTLAHELGHYFNLYHTFQNNKSSHTATRELVIRPDWPQKTRPFPANCDVAGDYVCDTPADPYGLPGAVISGCVYSGTITDANGDMFTPATDNIMSYYLTCSQPHTFTPGQYERMVNGLSLRLASGNDYALTCTDKLLAPTNLTVSLASNGAQLKFIAADNNAAGFLIERSLEPTTNFSVIGSLPPNSFSFVDGSLDPNTTYYYRVKASNATDQYSKVVSLQSGLFYCIPTYSWPVGNFFPKIETFILAGSKSTLRSVATGSDQSGYSDFTDSPHAVFAGRVYSFTASAVADNSTSYISQHLSIWLDSNKDGLFDNTERLFQSSANQLLNPSLTDHLTIPASLSPGLVRLRVRSQYAPDGLVESACATYNSGETEDYTLLIDIQPRVSCFSLKAKSTAVHCADSHDGSISLLVTGGTAPFSYSLSDQSNTTGIFTGLSGGSYTATVTDAEACRQTLVVTIAQPTSSIASLFGSATICEGQSTALTLSISGSNGPYQIQLTTGSSGSSLVGYASDTTIAVSPTRTTTYQLKAITDAGNCPVSLKSTTATVTVNSISPAIISPENASVCRGQSLTLTAGSGQQYRWNTGHKDPFLVVTESGLYSVTVINEAGCTSKAQTSVLVADCARPMLFLAKIQLEGFVDVNSGLMNTSLVASKLLPKQQPFSIKPWYYPGTEQVSSFPDNVTDWILIMARNASGDILAQKAAFLRNDGILIDINGSEGIVFPSVQGDIYVSVHHRNHLAIQSAKPITNAQLVDFTSDPTAVRGVAQLKKLAGRLVMYVGDYDTNDIINSEDYNKWKLNASTVGRYLPIDSDGNGVINNKDFNHWMINRSKIGTPGL